MAKLTIVPQKIFGGTGGVGEFGAFGSDALGTPTTTKDIATIQSLAPYLQGWFAATDNANEPPRIQDLNGLFLMVTSQLGYLFQNGVPEWHASAEYYATVSYCQKGGIIYRSKTGTDGSPNLNHDPATDDGTNWEAGEASYRQLKFDLDRLGFTGYALYSDQYLPSKLKIAEQKFVGEWVFTDRKLTPTAFAAARSTAHTAYPEYCPVIPRFDADHDITTTETTQAVIDALNTEVVTFAGVSEWSATNAAGTWTFADSTGPNALINMITAAAMVNRWHQSGEAGNYADSGALYTGARQYAITVNGVNYAITGASIGSHTITTASYPANGTYNVSFGPSRIAGSSTSARLRKIAGFVPVAGGDYTGEVAIMIDAMDRMHLHYHTLFRPDNNTPALFGNTAATGSAASAISGSGSAYYAATPITAGTATGVPRTGKTTDSRRHGVGAYTFLGVLLATTWTSA